MLIKDNNLMKFIYLIVILHNVKRCQGEEITDTCLLCICEALGSCSKTDCGNDVCGPFGITWAYWADAGKLTLDNDTPESGTGFANCANDLYCASSTVKNYMSKFTQDCNGDGVINCLDFAAIHKLGGYGCTGDISYQFYSALDACLQRNY